MLYDYLLHRYFIQQKIKVNINQKKTESVCIKMEPIGINPQLDVNATDQSKIDESITTDNSPIYNTGTINQNCGNQREMSRFASMMWGIAVSLACDIVIIGLMLYGFRLLASNFNVKLEKIDTVAGITHNDIRRESSVKMAAMLSESKIEMQKIVKEERITNIWILRHDILRTIDLHTAKKSITQEQYKYLKEEYDHYREIGGNHDVKEKFDAFTLKIFGTNEIKITPSY